MCPVTGFPLNDNLVFAVSLFVNPSLCNLYCRQGLLLSQNIAHPYKSPKKEFPQSCTYRVASRSKTS